MRITDALLGEHGVFYALFDQLEASLAEVGTARELAVAVELLRAALVSHARLEDELLFPELRGEGEGSSPGGRSESHEIDGLLGRVVAMTDIEAMRAAVSSLLELMREHFIKEERMVLRAAASRFDESKQQELGRQWAKLRSVEL
ncbi:MAG: hemerythrin domain-containing protein [Sorangiineae bacterium]|nr:hemerythrin domain-containing protein [Polyangiaceae bacterium]MEB2322886.1 hemerythrin domain-containing protein [Sorangiineae bacterium]